MKDTPNGERSCGSITERSRRPHDLLAGAWRFENRQLVLRFDAEGAVDTVEATWLAWLRKETADWIEAPRIVRSVQLILTNQNQPIGYAAESQLWLDILERFPDVPWNAGKREVYEADAKKDLLRIQQQEGQPNATVTAEGSHREIRWNDNVVTL